MNENETKVSIILTQFESLIEDHSTYLNELENILVIPEIDYEKAIRLLRRMRRVRKDLYSGIKTMAENLGNIQDQKLKEEALGILSYLHIIGFKDEKEMLQNLNDQAKKLGYDIDVENDIRQIDEIIAFISKINSQS